MPVRQCKRPASCNSFRLLIFLLIYLNLLYMFRTTNSPIFRCTFLNNDVSSQQDSTIFVYWYFYWSIESALHVSGEKLSHLQEHFLEQRCEQPTKCNNFRLLIFLLIYFNLLYILHLKVEMDFYLYLFTGLQQYRCILPGFNIKVKVLLKMGEFVARNMWSRFK